MRAYGKSFPRNGSVGLKSVVCTMTIKTAGFITKSAVFKLFAIFSFLIFAKIQL